MLRLSDLVREDCILLGVEADDKTHLIRSMVDRLVEVGLVRASEPVLESLLQREKVMSTGIGGGVAIPHAQTEAASSLCVSLARPARTVDFESLDEKPVELVFLVVGPAGRGGFIRILARISRLLYAGALQSRLREAGDPKEARQILVQEEAGLNAQ